jgi:acetoin utilization protein AcuB
MQIPKTGELMTAAPKTIGEDMNIATAKQLMTHYNIRHLPVLQAGRLVGILSDRDIKVAESFRGPGELTVQEVMTPNPYIVDEDEPIDQVLMTMADRKLGSVLVCHARSNNVVGIFTDTDALRFCGQLLQRASSHRAA